VARRVGAAAAVARGHGRRAWVVQVRDMGRRGE
jgi:hypothetical protein